MGAPGGGLPRLLSLSGVWWECWARCARGVDGCAQVRYAAAIENAFPGRRGKSFIARKVVHVQTPGDPAQELGGHCAPGGRLWFGCCVDILLEGFASIGSAVVAALAVCGFRCCRTAPGMIV